MGAAGTSTNTITGATNSITATTANNIVGVTNINTTSGSTTNIATDTAATTNIGVMNGTNVIEGTTSINASVNNATNINTGTSTGAVTIGNSANTTNLNSATNNIGVNTFATTNNLGTGSAVSINNIGNSQSGTTVTASAGNSVLSMANGTATTTVTSGTSVLAGATQATTGQTNIANQGGSGAVVDENGKITQGIVGQTTGSMVVTNGVGNTHGFVVTETEAVMSGGVNSTSLTLDDRGATFSNSATGAPVTVTGVADGSADFDAVNVRQYAHAIAAVSASAHIPAPQPGKDMSVGLGVGHYMGKTALAFGGNFRVSANAMIKASISSGLNGGSKPVVGVGAGWSW